MDLEGAVAEFEVGYEGETAFIVAHPEVQPALVATGGPDGFAAELDQPAGFPVVEFDFADLRAGHFAEEGLLVLEDVS